MTRDQLIELLGHVQESECWVGSEDDDLYMDWSVETGQDRVRFEVGDGTDAIHLEIPVSDVERLHAALTLWLLRRQSG